MDPFQTDRHTMSRRDTSSTSAVSPDGQWLAYYSNQSGRQEVYVQRGG
ncbi:MAG: hypothetical protein DSY84_03485 [Candidatus Neomarinimicrobiota bacterium]|nr:MAG: hypothetical protein DSY84_03485 [Candidatus Neomarinimicrobiota bacterium]